MRGEKKREGRLKEKRGEKGDYRREEEGKEGKSRGEREKTE